MLRITLAVAAGFLIMSVFVIATQVALLRYLSQTPAYFLAYGVVRMVYAVIGGCVTAAIGKKYEAPTILGALLLGTAIGNLVMNRSGEPVWYAVLVGLVGAVVATMAGYRWLGRLPAEVKR
jgi:uncharacterized membrane protein